NLCGFFLCSWRKRNGAPIVAKVGKQWDASVYRNFRHTIALLINSRRNVLAIESQRRRTRWHQGFTNKKHLHLTGLGGDPRIYRGCKGHDQCLRVCAANLSGEVYTYTSDIKPPGVFMERHWATQN